MYELRVLSGLHRGATLPMDGLPHVIGASEDADVVLVDPGLLERHARLLLTDSGWEISALDGSVRDAESNKPQESIALSPGEFARVGDIWLTVVEQGMPWDNPPPVPVDEEEPTAAEDRIPVSELMGEFSEDAPPAIASATAIAKPAAGDDDKPTAVIEVKDGKKSRRWAYGSLVAGAVLSAATAYAITSRPAPPEPEKRPDIREQIREQVGTKAQSEKSASKRQPHRKPMAEDAAKASKASEQSMAQSADLSAEELRKAFRKRLSDADLLKRFDMTLNEQEWSMQAALDDEETARFERILAAFVKAHHITFPIHARVGNGESMLPFKIRQVTTGTNASVVTADGERIYIGEEYKGVRLAAVNDNRLTFTGKRKIEVKW